MLKREMDSMLKGENISETICSGSENIVVAQLNLLSLVFLWVVSLFLMQLPEYVSV